MWSCNRLLTASVSASAVDLHFLFNGPLHQDIKGMFLEQPEGRVWLTPAWVVYMAEARWSTFVKQNNRQRVRVPIMHTSSRMLLAGRPAKEPLSASA
jgi:hypothetical protein